MLVMFLFLLLLGIGLALIGIDALSEDLIGVLLILAGVLCIGLSSLALAERDYNNWKKDCVAHNLKVINLNYCVDSSGKILQKYGS